MNLSNEDVQDILSLLDSLPYTELTLQTSRFALHLRRAAGGGWTQETQVLSQPALADPAAPAVPPGPPAGPAAAGGLPPAGTPQPATRTGTPPARGSSPGAPGASGAGAGDAGDVVTPLPGTFYRAPQPGAAPFVEVGDRVGPGTVVAIIETMKLMNPVYAGTAGTVTEICLDDGQFAGQGAVLMRVSAGAG